MSQEEINLEEYGAIQILEKLSENCYFFNKRILELNEHLLCYYSDIPPDFLKKRQIPPNYFPKYGVQVLNIEEIILDDEQIRRLRRPNIFSITFDKSKLINFKKRGKEAGIMKDRYTAEYDQDFNSTQQNTNVLDKNAKTEARKNKVQWIFCCKSQNERDSWRIKLITLQRLLKEQMYQKQRYQKLGIKENYSPMQGKGYNPGPSMYNSGGYYGNPIGIMQQSNLKNGRLDKIEEEDKYLNSVDNGELAVSHENSHDFQRSQSGELKLSQGNNSLNNRGAINRILSGGSESPQKGQSQQQIYQHHVQGEMMSHEEEIDQNEQQKKRQNERGYSVNQHYETLLLPNQIKQTESALSQNKYAPQEEEVDNLEQLRQKEEEKKKKEQDEEEERKRKEKEEMERMKKQKEEEEQRIKNKLVYDSSYELQYQDQLNSNNILQQVIIDHPSTFVNLNQSTNLDHIQNYQFEQTTFNRQTSQFSPTIKKEKIDERFKKSYELLSLIGNFNEAAQEATKLLIEDLIFTGNMKKYFPILMKRDSPFMDQAMNDKSFEMQPSYEFMVEVKRYNNFIIKLSWVTQENIELYSNQQIDNIPSQFQEQLNYQDSSMGQIIERFINESPVVTRRLAKQREDKMRDEFVPSILVYTNDNGKSLSSEFKALNLINTWHSQHKTNDQSHVKVPLSCIVTYRGFKALVQANSPDAEGLVHGPMVNQDKRYEGYKTHPQIIPILQKIGEDLGIKPHKFKYGNKPKCQVYLSFVTEVHYNQRIQNLRQQIKYPETQSPGQKVETYYLKNVGDIFPVNDNYLSESSKYKVIQFRHEYLKKLDKQLNPDAYEDKDYDNPDNQEDVEDLVQASIYLETSYLQKFLQNVDELNFNIIDSLTLVETMHKQGINMKYLGYIATNSTIPFIMNLCIIDMLARAFKKVLNATISDLYINSQKYVSSNEELNKKFQQTPTNQLLQKAQTFGKTNSQLQLSQSQSLIQTQQSQTSLNAQTNTNYNQSNQRIKEFKIRQLDELVKDAIIDILNMLFGKDEESDNFHDILNQQIKYDFNYSQNIDLNTINPGQLLESICFHCELNMVYTADIFTQYEKKLNDYQRVVKNTRKQDNLQEEKKPITLFTRDNYIDHYVQSQVFTMDCQTVVQYVHQHEDNYEHPESYEVQINSIKQHINILKYSNSLTFFKYIQLLSIMSKLYFHKKDYLNASRTANEVITHCSKNFNYLPQLKLKKELDDDPVIVPNIHLVKSMITLIQISLKKEISEEVKNMTVIATKNIMKMIKFVVDESHPLYYELTKVFINDKLKKKDYSFENMKQVMEKELDGLVKALGSHHVRTADRYKDFAIYLFDFDSSGSVVYFEKAYNIYSVNQNQQEKDIAAQLIGSSIPTSNLHWQTNIQESRAICAYYLCNIYYNQNKIDPCWDFLKITTEYFQDKKEHLEKLCKLYLLKCNLVKRNNSAKQIVEICEQTWQFYNDYPYNKVKLLDFYKDLIKMITETIVSTWNRNFKAQFDQVTNIFKELIKGSNKFSEKVRNQAMIKKDTTFASSLNSSVILTDSLKQSVDLTSPQNSNLKIK